MEHKYQTVPRMSISINMSIKFVCLHVYQHLCRYVSRHTYRPKRQRWTFTSPQKKISCLLRGQRKSGLAHWVCCQTTHPQQAKRIMTHLVSADGTCRQDISVYCSRLFLQARPMKTLSLVFQAQTLPWTVTWLTSKLICMLRPLVVSHLSLPSVSLTAGAVNTPYLYHGTAHTMAYTMPYGMRPAAYSMASLL